MNQTASGSIQKLSAAAAQIALYRFYESLPAQAWKGAKPTPADLALWLDDAQDFLPAETLTVIDALLSDKEEALRGEIARHLLADFWGQDALRPHVEQGLRRSEAAKAPQPPALMGAFVAALAVFPGAKKEANSPLRIAWDLAGSAAQLGSRLPGLARVTSARAAKSCAPIAKVSANIALWQVAPATNSQPLLAACVTAR